MVAAAAPPLGAPSDLRVDPKRARVCDIAVIDVERPPEAGAAGMLRLVDWLVVVAAGRMSSLPWFGVASRRSSSVSSLTIESPPTPLHHERISNRAAGGSDTMIVPLARRHVGQGAVRDLFSGLHMTRVREAWRIWTAAAVDKFMQGLCQGRRDGSPTFLFCQTESGLGSGDVHWPAAMRSCRYGTILQCILHSKPARDLCCQSSMCAGTRVGRREMAASGGAGAASRTSLHRTKRQAIRLP